MSNSSSFDMVAPVREGGTSRRRLWVGAGLVVLLGLACVAYRSDGEEHGAASALAVQSLHTDEASSGFKVIAGWKSQHHAYARECPAKSHCCSLTFLAPRPSRAGLCRGGLQKPSTARGLRRLRRDCRAQPVTRLGGQTMSSRSLWTRARPDS